MIINVKKITVLVGVGTDKISIHTDMPYPYEYNPKGNKMDLTFDATPNAGYEYVINNFPGGIDVEVIYARTGKTAHSVTPGPSLKQ